MDKQAYLEDIYNSSFEDEIEKIAMMGKGTAVAAYKGGSDAAKKTGKRLLNILHEGSNRAHSRGAGVLGVEKGSKPAMSRSKKRYSLIKKMNRKVYGKMDPRRYLQG